MLNLQRQIEHEPFDQTGSRLNILRRQIAFYRQNLRQSSDVEFATIYAREILEAQRELTDLLNQVRPEQR
jgi:hypothetical protein